MIYIVLREKGMRSDGYYYESKTSVLGAFDDPVKAATFLKKATEHYYPDEKPCEGSYDRYGDTKLVFHIAEDLCDRFWIQCFYNNEEWLED